MVIKSEGFRSLLKKTGHSLGTFFFILVKDISDLGFKKKKNPVSKLLVSTTKNVQYA